MVIKPFYLNTGILLVSLFLIGSSYANPVTSVSIVSSGQTLKAVTNLSEINACKKFTPTTEQVINFFNHAYPVDTHFAIDTATHPATHKAISHMAASYPENGCYIQVGLRRWF